MSALRRLGLSATVYVLSSMLQKGAAFLLLPLYTRFLPPQEYGTYAVVLGITQFLVVIFPLQLDAAVLRFYYQYRDDPETLREFWGSVLTFLILLTASFGGLALLFGEPLFRPFLGDIPLWPYMALAISTAVFQPFFQVFLSILQAREKPVRYAIASFSYFLSTTVTTIGLVVWAGFGAEGPLLATAVGSCAFAIFALIILKPDYRFCLKWHHLRMAVSYSAPVIPHGMAGVVLGVTDRIALNRLQGTAAVGVYNIGFVVGSVVDIIAAGVNRAFTPIAMGMRSNEDAGDHHQLLEAGLTIMGLICLVSCGVSIFSPELIFVFAAPVFYEGRGVVPFIASAGLASSIYYVFSNVLFYDRRYVKFVPVGTGIAAVINVALNILLIPIFGILGSAAATLGAQLVSTIVIGFIGSRIETVYWPYGRIGLAYVCVCGIAFTTLYVLPNLSVVNVLFKFMVLTALIPVVSFLLWNNPLRLVQMALRLARERGLIAA